MTGEEIEAIAIVQAQIQLHGVAVRERIHHMPGTHGGALEPAHLAAATASGHHRKEAVLFRMPPVVGAAGFDDGEIGDEGKKGTMIWESVTAKSWTIPG
ncbi:MAG: hypothetical protein WDM77_08675 [Steroidobacteraceae bacterium]